jgi:uncharacterized protein
VDQARYEAEIRAYQERREARQRGEEGWFTLVDRIWLEPGENMLPIGTLRLEHGILRLSVPEGRAVTLRGAPVREAELRPEGDGGRGDVLECGGRRYDFIRRGDRVSARVRDPQAPARFRFQGIPRYPTRLEWRREGRFLAHDPPRSFAMPFTTGELEDRTCPGAVEFDHEGRSYRLDVVIEPLPDRLFVLFADATNRDETYGAGRLFYTAMPEDGRVVLDFNKALNPACVFNPLVICPLPPPGNRLPFRVEAGEKNWIPVAG